MITHTQLSKTDKISHDNNDISSGWVLIRMHDHKLCSPVCISLSMIPHYQRKVSQRYRYVIGHTSDNGRTAQYS